MDTYSEFEAHLVMSTDPELPTGYVFVWEVLYARIRIPKYRTTRPVLRLEGHRWWFATPLSEVGDTYTVLLSGDDTAGRYCLIDMHIPPGGGPPPHRHHFEESFTILEGEIEATFRGEKSVVSAGETIHIPANAPHSFANTSREPARLLCICAPAGQEEFFAQVGVPVLNRTAPPPKLDADGQGAFIKKTVELAPKYQTELLKPE